MLTRAAELYMCQAIDLSMRAPNLISCTHASYERLIYNHMCIITYMNAIACIRFHIFHDVT